MKIIIYRVLLFVVFVVCDIYSYAQVKITLSYLEIDSVPTLQVRYYNDTPNDVYFSKITDSNSRLPIFFGFLTESFLSKPIECDNKFIKDTIDVTISGYWHIYEHFVCKYEDNTDEEVEVVEPLSLSNLFNLYNIKVMELKSFIDLTERMNDWHIYELTFLKTKESHIEYFDLSAFRYFGGYYRIKCPAKQMFSDEMIHTFIETKEQPNGTLIEEGFANSPKAKFDEISLPDTLGGYKLYREPYECNELIVDFTK